MHLVERGAPAFANLEGRIELSRQLARMGHRAKAGGAKPLATARAPSRWDVSWSFRGWKPWSVQALVYTRIGGLQSLLQAALCMLRRGSKGPLCILPLLCHHSGAGLVKGNVSRSPLQDERPPFSRARLGGF